jgi:hypothetical protein
VWFKGPGEVSSLGQQQLQRTSLGCFQVEIEVNLRQIVTRGGVSGFTKISHTIGVKGIPKERVGEGDT